MSTTELVQEILEGKDVRVLLKKPGLTEASAYDENWLLNVDQAAAKVFGSDKALWDLMSFAPDKFFPDELQDALNAYSAWYQKFLKVKKEEFK